MGQHPPGLYGGDARHGRARRARPAELGARADVAALRARLDAGWVGTRLPLKEAQAELGFSNHVLQQRISALEEHISHRREFYNAAVNLNKLRPEQFPDMLLASFARPTRKPRFEAALAERTSKAAPHAGGIQHPGGQKHGCTVVALEGRVAAGVGQHR